ncbi:MAG: Hsp20/alpha crystallin family protein [Planctomycetes bacterium]|nr:Hsp20/alpha crystallin family protein [Planctomycetota bacterium]
MPTSKVDIIKDVVEMQNEMVRTFQEFLLSTQPATSVHTDGWRPPTDVYETPDEVVIRMEIPGIEAEDFQIAVDGDRLIVQGQRGDVPRRPGTQFRQMEIHVGPFQRVIKMPGPIEESRVKATYSGGFLEVSVPKARGRKTTRVIILRES